MAPVPHGHWKTTTLVAALRTTGITAPYVLDGAMTGATFRAYVEISSPDPQSRRYQSSWTTCHATRWPVSARAIESIGAKLVYLPPYSPDLNPIEQAFAKLKAMLRKAGERTRDGLWDAIARILDTTLPLSAATSSETPDMQLDRKMH